jgi:hypothetical protein
MAKACAVAGAALIAALEAATDAPRYKGGAANFCRGGPSRDEAHYVELLTRLQAGDWNVGCYFHDGSRPATTSPF